jgi:hypothetical protein
MIVAVLVMSGGRIAFVVMLPALCANIAAIVLRLHKPSTFDIYLVVHGSRLRLRSALLSVVPCSDEVG